ncbi:MAG: hypothetical protein C0483_20530 [Pirellula sp.]|nr:hypothetical protein [Pirellula sp.]
MTLQSGKDGKVLIGATPVADVVRWTFRSTAQSKAYASNATGERLRQVPGTRSGTGTVAFQLNAAAPATSPLAAGSVVTLLLHLDAVRHYEIPSVIEHVELQVDVDTGALIGGSAQFATDGVWTEPSFG